MLTLSSPLKLREQSLAAVPALVRQYATAKAGSFPSQPLLVNRELTSHVTSCVGGFVNSRVPHRRYFLECGCPRNWSCSQYVACVGGDFILSDLLAGIAIGDGIARVYGLRNVQGECRQAEAPR